MTVLAETAEETEPPPAETPDVLVDRVMTVAHLQESAHVALIGHHTLPLLLALLRRGCGAVRSLRPGAPSPDCEAADLAWIVDANGESELDDALRAARSRVGDKGCVIVEGDGCTQATGLGVIGKHTTALGLDIVSFDHVARRLVLTARRPLALAA